jgi:hypothetical protein
LGPCHPGRWLVLEAPIPGGDKRPPGGPGP